MYELMYEATLPDELNTFYARFDLHDKESAVKSTPPPDDRPLSVSTADVRKTLLMVNIIKAAGPDNIPSCVLSTCANQLVDVITDIFNISLWVFPSAPRQPRWSLYLKSLQCLV